MNKREMEAKSSSDFGTENSTNQNTAKAVTVTVQACTLSKLRTVISVIIVCNYCLHTTLFAMTPTVLVDDVHHT